MIVSVGILAHNERDSIAAMLMSLFQQSVFTSQANHAGVAQWEVIVVPNGCTDDTAAVARAALDRAVSGLADLSIRHEVLELREGGKSNAWNHFVHEMSRPDADVIVMLDSDIEFGHPDTLLNSLRELQCNSHSRVVVDTSLKHFVQRQQLTPLEAISKRAPQQPAGHLSARVANGDRRRTELLSHLGLPQVCDRPDWPQCRPADPQLLA